MQEYVAFTDESYITASRYRSISALSIPKSNYQTIFHDAEKILKDSRVNEFKWSELKSKNDYECAEKLIRLVLNNISSSSLRVDTILWDTQDSRHEVIRRDDIANYGRMLFHLLNHTMKSRPKG
ncbi:MAG: hypothetical protein N3A69_17070, partial [Leptospiraceae bacterium]|nr:hypothetical protein [Leptospiraceae bacterium]